MIGTCTIYLNDKEICAVPHSVFMNFIWQQTATICLKSNKVFTLQCRRRECLLFLGQTEFQAFFYELCDYIFKFLKMIQKQNWNWLYGFQSLTAVIIICVALRMRNPAEITFHLTTWAPYASCCMRWLFQLGAHLAQNRVTCGESESGNVGNWSASLPL